MKFSRSETKLSKNFVSLNLLFTVFSRAIENTLNDLFILDYINQEWNSIQKFWDKPNFLRTAELKNTLQEAISANNWIKVAILAMLLWNRYDN